MLGRFEDAGKIPRSSRAGLRTSGKITTTNPWLRLPIPRGGTGLPWWIAGGECWATRKNFQAHARTWNGLALEDDCLSDAVAFLAA